MLHGRMCGIGGIVSSGEAVPGLKGRLRLMNSIQQHRGPDGEGIWTHGRAHVGLAHRRLAIIDRAGGAQPMSDGLGNRVTFNGEIYNYVELREELGSSSFTTTSDTEVILRAYQRWGVSCVSRLRGMFAFALWDDERQQLVCARDRLGIKPFCYATIGHDIYFASEAKALLPFLDDIATDMEGLADYLVFQFCLGGKTLFRGVRDLPPAHTMIVRSGSTHIARYWQLGQEIDHEHSAAHFGERVLGLLHDSVNLHVRSDVPLGVTVSGGLDSSTVAALARREVSDELLAFNGKFSLSPAYDESRYARAVARSCDLRLLERDITAPELIDHLGQVVYHLDYPAAGPGAFPQFMLFELVGRHRKVVLGGLGGDELFGGYARYLIAYLEQSIKAAVDGPEADEARARIFQSTVPNLAALRSYRPLIREFRREGMFGELDRSYYRLIARTPHDADEINWKALGDYSPFETFQGLFRNGHAGPSTCLDRMTRFDLQASLPALLQVEDRMSMAHGVESRVPVLDHPLVELAATIPDRLKLEDGALKAVLRRAARPLLPEAITSRSDKMGFPVPLAEWLQGEARELVHDLLSSTAATGRELVDNRKVLASLDREPQFGRKLWGLLCLELWQQTFHDRGAELRATARDEAISREEAIAV